MKHLILVGDMGSIDIMVENILQKYPKAVKQLSVVQSVQVVQTPQPQLKILTAAPQPQIQFVNMVTLTLLYSLPGDEVINLLEVLPENQREAYKNQQSGVAN